MAGSYNHCVSTDGQLYTNRDLIQRIENLGDAYEAIEEMYGMIWWMADQFPGVATAKDRTEWVERANRNYRIGLHVSPGTLGKLPMDDI